MAEGKERKAKNKRQKRHNIRQHKTQPTSDKQTKAIDHVSIINYNKQPTEQVHVITLVYSRK